MFVRADVDGGPIMATADPGVPIIITQTQRSLFQVPGSKNAPISVDAKAITVEFEVSYDTIPKTGVRRSYRKITYPLNWANGKDNPPLLEPKTIDEWEK